MRRSLFRLLAALTNDYQIGPDHIFSHREYKANISPGDTVQQLIDEFRGWEAREKSWPGAQENPLPRGTLRPAGS